MDFTAEWPLRVAVIRHRGQLTHVVTLVSHLATDAGGIVLMMAELAAGTSTPVDGMPPLAQAVWQRSPAGRRHNEAALRYWESVLSHDRATPVQRAARAQPEVLARRVSRPPCCCRPWRTISDRSGLGTSTVFLALFAVALANVTGINPVVVAADRQQPVPARPRRLGCVPWRRPVCACSTSAGQPFDEALRRVQRSVINAYKYAYFDTRTWSRSGRASSGSAAPPSTPAASSTTVTACSPTGCSTIRHRGEFRWVRSQDSPPFERLFVDIDDVPDAIRVTLHLGHPIDIPCRRGGSGSAAWRPPRSGSQRATGSNDQVVSRSSW